MFHTPGQYYQAAVANKEAYVKPTVKAVFLEQPQIGYGCTVVPRDHPAVYLNDRIAYTSKVEAITENGFETHNTLYVKD